MPDHDEDSKFLHRMVEPGEYADENASDWSAHGSANRDNYFARISEEARTWDSKKDMPPHDEVGSRAGNYRNKNRFPAEEVLPPQRLTPNHCVLHVDC